MAKKSKELQEQKETIFQEIQRECEALQHKGIALSKALYLIGWDYENGRDRIQDFPTAIYCMMRAAELGNSEAMKHLAGMYERLTDRDAARHLVSMYKLDEDASKNLDRAVMFYMMAADTGDSEAMKKLGALFAEGEKMALDGENAVIWYEKAAALDDSYVLEALGDIYSQGKIVKRDIDKAAEWYQKAMDATTWYAMQRGIMEKMIQMYKTADQPKQVAYWQERLEAAEEKYREEGQAMSARSGGGE